MTACDSRDSFRGDNNVSRSMYFILQYDFFLFFFVMCCNMNLAINKIVINDYSDNKS